MMLNFRTTEDWETKEPKYHRSCGYLSTTSHGPHRPTGVHRNPLELMRDNYITLEILRR